MFHIECNTFAFVAVSSSLSTDLIKERISALGILPELTGVGESDSVEISTKFIGRMYKNVYPLIHGLDHDRLICFYSLLADCESSDTLAQNHVKLLKKLRSAAAGSSSHSVTIIVIVIVMIVG